MPSYLDYMKQVKDNLDQQAAVFTKIDEECAAGRASSEPTKEERELLTKYGQAADEAEKRASDYKQFEEMKQKNDERRNALKEIDRTFGGGFENDRDRDSRQQNGRGERGEQRVMTIGEQFVNDKQFRQWLKDISPNGRVPSDVRLHSPAVEVRTLVTGASSTSAGAFVITDRKPIVDPGTFYQPLTLLDLLTMGTTDGDTVDYVREGTHTSNAAVVAEATATGDSSGSAPESAMALSIVTENVKSIKHWIPTTRRALQDASQMRTLIDTFLRYGVAKKLEQQVLSGDGTGENFTGLHNMSGITQQAFDTDIVTTTRKGRTKVKVTGRATPTGYLMHPNDWEDFDLLQDNEARYLYGGPSMMGAPRLWGLPVVECEAQTEGQAAVTQWDMGVVWDRMQTTIFTSTDHQDFFVRGLVAILAEMRAAFTFVRPAAFVEIDLTA